VQGFGFGLVFVPLSTVAFLLCPTICATDGTSMLTLMRQCRKLDRNLRRHRATDRGRPPCYAVLSQHVTPFNHALQMPDVRSLIDPQQRRADAHWPDVMVGLQAQIIAFSLDLPDVTLFTLSRFRWRS